MSRADACVPFLHGHTRRCNQAGYANGRADALEEANKRLAEMRHEDWCCAEGCTGHHGAMCPGCACFRGIVFAHMGWTP